MDVVSILSHGIDISINRSQRLECIDNKWYLSRAEMSGVSKTLSFCLLISCGSSLTTLLSGIWWDFVLYATHQQYRWLRVRVPVLSWRRIILHLLWCLLDYLEMSDKMMFETRAASRLVCMYVKRHGRTLSEGTAYFLTDSPVIGFEKISERPIFLSEEMCSWFRCDNGVDILYWRALKLDGVPNAFIEVSEFFVLVLCIVRRETWQHCTYHHYNQLVGYDKDLERL